MPYARRFGRFFAVARPGSGICRRILETWCSKPIISSYLLFIYGRPSLDKLKVACSLKKIIKFGFCPFQNASKCHAILGQIKFRINLNKFSMERYIVIAGE